MSDELHSNCLEARDYAGCVKTYKNLTPKKDEKMSVIGIRLYLNSDTVN